VEWPIVKITLSTAGASDLPGISDFTPRFCIAARGFAEVRVLFNLGFI
jgi:hypothetical protein